MNESRRNFIKQAGKVIAGTAILGSVDACSPENFQEHAEYIFESKNGAEIQKTDAWKNGRLASVFLYLIKTWQIKAE